MQTNIHTTQIDDLELLQQGTVRFVATKAEADALVPSLANNVYVIVDADESRQGERVRYTVASGALTNPVSNTGAMSLTSLEQLINVANTAAQNKQTLVYDATNSEWKASFQYLDLASSQSGTLDSSFILANFRPGSNLELAENLAGSSAYCGTAATNNAVFSLKKNGTNIAFFTFAPGNTEATFPILAAQTFTPTDKISLVAPSTPDATLANVSFRIRFKEI